MASGWDRGKGWPASGHGPVILSGAKDLEWLPRSDLGFSCLRTLEILRSARDDGW
jgi:hypothetical protein